MKKSEKRKWANNTVLAVIGLCFFSFSYLLYTAGDNPLALLSAAVIPTLGLLWEC